MCGVYEGWQQCGWRGDGVMVFQLHEGGALCEATAACLGFVLSVSEQSSPTVVYQ